MIAKLGKSSVVLFATLIATVAYSADAEPWDNKPVGNCYKSLDHYAGMKFGLEYEKDDNIKIIPLPEVGFSRGGLHYFWVSDMTPTQNYSRVLFKVQKSGRACAIMLAVSSTSVSLERIENGVLPFHITTTETVAVGPATVVVYQLNNTSGNYFPFRCYKSLLNNRKKIACNKAFD